ncbi:hypothetical protein T09_3463 [Trichinella sp. T9]|nr:hypothetical protein T09_3463 [Trichinella sp. T9]
MQFIEHLPAVRISNVESTFNNKNLLNGELYRCPVIVDKNIRFNKKYLKCCCFALRDSGENFA